LVLPPAFLITIALLRPSAADENPKRTFRAGTPTLPTSATAPDPPLLLQTLANMFKPPPLPPPNSQTDSPPSPANSRRAYQDEVFLVAADRLELACSAYLERKFVRCVQFCDDVLRVDPSYEIALTLKSVTQRSMHASWADPEFFDATARGWRRVAYNGWLPTPEGIEFHVPSEFDWRVIRALISADRDEGRDEVDPDFLAIRRKLDTMKIDLTFTDARLEDLLSFIRDFSGLNIVLDPRASLRLEELSRMTVRAKDLALKEALDFVLSLQGMVYRVTEKLVVLVSYEVDPDRY
jgi:hypothetical protein